MLSWRVSLGSGEVLHCETLVQFLAIRCMSVGNPLMLCPLEFLPHTSVHSVSSSSLILPFKCFYQFMAPVASVPGKQTLAMSLDVPVFSYFRLVVCPHLCLKIKLHLSTRKYFLDSRNICVHSLISLFIF